MQERNFKIDLNFRSLNKQYLPPEPSIKQTKKANQESKPRKQTKKANVRSQIQNQSILNK